MEREMYRLSKEHVSNQKRFVTVNIEHFALSNWSVADFQRRLSFFNKRNYYSTWMSELPAFPRSQQLGIRVTVSGQAFFFMLWSAGVALTWAFKFNMKPPYGALVPKGGCRKIAWTTSLLHALVKTRDSEYLRCFFFFFSWTDKLPSRRAPLLSCE